MAKRAAKKAEKVVGGVCIYGTSRTGSGYIAETADGRLLGDGEPRPNWTGTEALRLACAALREAGARVGLVTVHIDSPTAGPMVAYADVARPGYFGQLAWTYAEPAVTLSAEAVLAAAEQEEVR